MITAPAKKILTIKHLMLHTSGLSYGFVGNEPVEQEYKKRKPVDHRSTLQGMTKTLSEIPLAFEVQNGSTAYPSTCSGD
ncbi:MAG: hypothetical protein VB980_03650 [Opitutales bacterium]|jgi:CubicO group peptidase (beta-lactamase class C family)